MAKTVPSSTDPNGGSPRRGFGGLRVLSFESRLAADTARLIRKAGGVPIEAPALQEVPIGRNEEAFAFATELLAGHVDVVIFTTGVGTRGLFKAMETTAPREDLIAALSRVATVARGPKPVAVLREIGVPVTVKAAEPNTWREVVTAIEESPQAITMKGARVAVQEYGASNRALVDELESRGAIVTAVPVYRWALPEDLFPLLDGARQVIDRTADVLLFTSASQARNLVTVLGERGLETAFREALPEVVVASVGPVCSETLASLGFDVDVEPETHKLGSLIARTAEVAGEMLIERRSRLRESRPVTTAARATTPTTTDVNDSPFMKACRGEPTDYTPVWLMRQAGRYMQEYREVRSRISFLELCKKPDLAAEVTVHAARRIDADAAIIFSDILLIVEPMGLGLDYVHGDGPSISRVVRAARDVDRLLEVEPEESLSFVFEAIRRTRAELEEHIPLLGFSGAPFTLASYIVEGGGSRNYTLTKSLMYQDEGAWHAMMSLIARAVTKYLCAQVQAGAQALQLFDSWVGCLSPGDYERYVLPHTKAVLEGLPTDVPVIHFGSDTATLLDLCVQAGSSVLGVDHRVAIGDVFERFPGVAVQGNLDPVVLFTNPDIVREHAKRLLDEVGGRPGHIFNLGHGVLPATPVDNVIALIDAVHELSSRG